MTKEKFVRSLGTLGDVWKQCVDLSRPYSSFTTFNAPVLRYNISTVKTTEFSFRIPQLKRTAFVVNLLVTTLGVRMVRQVEQTGTSMFDQGTLIRLAIRFMFTQVTPNNICSLHYHTAFVICVPNRGLQGGPHFPSECYTEGQQLFNATALGLHKASPHPVITPCFLLWFGSTKKYHLWEYTQEYFEQTKILTCSAICQGCKMPHIKPPPYSRSSRFDSRSKG
jgi:hypothetical protein